MMWILVSLFVSACIVSFVIFDKKGLGVRWFFGMWTTVFILEVLSWLLLSKITFIVIVVLLLFGAYVLSYVPKKGV